MDTPDAPAPAATAARAILAAVVRHAITAAGTALVAHGYLDQATADAATSPIADEAVGALMIVGAGAWGAIRARLSHTRWAAAWAALQGDPPPQP
jgi:hypothetical protein